MRSFGKAPFEVPAVGLGAGHIGNPAMAEEQVQELLLGALDLGVRLVDTAPSYGLSEERIGRHLRARRHNFVLSTKCGYGVPGVEDWTGRAISLGVDAALARLGTDRIDIMHLHSCPTETLAREDIQRAMEETGKAGKVLVWAYSGDNEPVDAAIASGQFGSIQTSVNLCDQRALSTTVLSARARGLGVIAKRPLANAPWRFAERPVGDYAEVYWERLAAMGLSASIDRKDLAWDELALRFSAFAEGVCCAIVGTGRLENLRRAAEAASRGPLPAETAENIRGAFRRVGGDWRGEI